MPWSCAHCGHNEYEQDTLYAGGNVINVGYWKASEILVRFCTECGMISGLFVKKPHRFKKKK